MNKTRTKSNFSRLAVAAFALVFVACTAVPASSPAGINAPSSKGGPVIGPEETPVPEYGGDPSLKDLGNGISVGTSVHNDSSKPLRDIEPITPGPKSDKPQIEKENPPLPLKDHIDKDDEVLQDSFGNTINAVNAMVIGAGFQGINQAGGCGNCAPPDTNGDVGPNHYVQSVNSSFAVYSKTGTKLYGPANINTLWSGFGGACQTRNDGDPIVLYDSMADRWLVSQFTAASPYYECVAISQTGDPLGAWYRYAFQLSTTDFPDYPHLGVWPDGYYMSVNIFLNGSSYGGPRPYVFDRAKMLAGQPATFQTTSAALGSGVNPIMPADLDGATLPATGAPNVFVGFGSTMKLYKFAVNWTTPSATTWTQHATLAPAGFTALCTTGRNCEPQRGTAQKLDGLGDRLMNRVAYRNLGTSESLLVSHAVMAGSSKRTQAAAMRWYEIRNPAATPSIYQQGTFSPDTTWRWMGSVAMDKNGGIGLGYSASSGTLYPSIRATGRLATDALGQMTQGESSLYAGTGFQNGVNRWGDYSNLSIDPVDGCTFWFTTEYNNSGGWAWSTYIGSFKLPNCQ